MTPSFIESEDQLVYEEQGSQAFLRTVFFVVGVVAMASSWIFIEVNVSMGKIEGAAKIGGFIFSILSIVVFCLFGGFCVKMALLSPRQKVIFDKLRQQIIYRTETPVQGRREMVYGFDNISKIEVMKNSSDDGPWYTVKVAISSAQPIVMGLFQNHDQATFHLNKVCRATGRPSLKRAAPHPDSPESCSWVKFDR